MYLNEIETDEIKQLISFFCSENWSQTEKSIIGFAVHLKNELVTHTSKVSAYKNVSEFFMNHSFNLWSDMPQLGLKWINIFG